MSGGRLRAREVILSLDNCLEPRLIYGARTSSHAPRETLHEYVRQLTLQAHHVIIDVPLRRVTHKPILFRRWRDKHRAVPIQSPTHGIQRCSRTSRPAFARAQIKASLAVNRELIQLYWDIGGSLVGRPAD